MRKIPVRIKKPCKDIKPILPGSGFIGKWDELLRSFGALYVQGFQDPVVDSLAFCEFILSSENQRWAVG